MATIKTILCPVDLSGRSIAAIRFAASLAHDYGARLVLLYVKEPTLEFGELSPMYPVETNYLAALQQLPVDPRIQVERRVDDGPPAEVILRVAKEAACDLIVMSTHGRRGIRRWVLGSVAEAVLRRAACPVLTVRESALDELETESIEAAQL